MTAVKRYGVFNAAGDLVAVEDGHYWAAEIAAEMTERYHKPYRVIPVVVTPMDRSGVASGREVG